MTDVPGTTHDINGYKITIFNEDLAPALPEEKYSGPSPYADKIGGGPSDLKVKPKPLMLTGQLDAKNEYFEVNPHVGREYPQAQLAEILKDSDQLHDLAATVSRRGVVFFRDQRSLSIEQQKLLADELGKIAGKPETSKLFVHPAASSCGYLGEDGKIDPEVLVLTTRWKGVYANKGYKAIRDEAGWHTDMSTEPVPVSYSILRMVETPPGQGGDTMWASGYALYEKLSPSFRSYFETLTARYSHKMIKDAFDDANFEIFTGPRGAPENIGDGLWADHPAVRTNPVTGWKSFYGFGSTFVTYNEVSGDESEMLIQHITDLLLRSPEIQVRLRWNPHDIAIWDNHSVFHAPTKVITSDITHRTIFRTTSIGERPYLDKNSLTISEALKEEEQETNKTEPPLSVSLSVKLSIK